MISIKTRGKNLRINYIDGSRNDTNEKNITK